MPLINISIRMSDGSKVDVPDVDTTFVIEDLKRLIEPRVSPPCPPDLQRLIYKGRILKDSDSIVGLGASALSRGGLAPPLRLLPLCVPRSHVTSHARADVAHTCVPAARCTPHLLLLSRLPQLLKRTPCASRSRSRATGRGLCPISGCFTPSTRWQ